MASCTCPSPFRERFNMRFPQVSERVKEAPAHALRAVFASIGQVLLVTDRMKNKPAEEEQAAGPHADEPAASSTPPAAGETIAAEKPASAAAGTATVAPAAEPAAKAPAAKPGASAAAPVATGAEAGAP